MLCGVLVVQQNFSNYSFLYFDILVGKLSLVANGFNSFESKTYLEENKKVNDFATSVVSKLLPKL